MNRIAFVSLYAVLCSVFAPDGEEANFDLREGDIVSTSSTRRQGAAMIAVTLSHCTHYGVAVNRNDTAGDSGAYFG